MARIFLEFLQLRLLLFCIIFENFKTEADNNQQQSNENFLTPEQLRLLLTASENGQLPIIRELLRKAPRQQLTAPVTWSQFDDGNTPLIKAASRDQLGAIKLLLPVLKDLITATNKANQTAIHVAIVNNATQVINFIFSKTIIAISPNLVDIREGTYNRTPLYLAAEIGNFQVVKFFAHLGANLMAQSSEMYGQAMAIHEAARWDHLEIVAFLHSRGCSLALQEGWWGRIPLHEAAINASLDMVRWLVERGSNVFAQSYPRDQLYTPIHWAVAMGRLEIVKYLLDFEPLLIDAIDRDGDKPIHTAALNNRTELVEFFLGFGMDVNLRQLSFSRSLLHQAASKGHLFLLRRLLELGADPYSVSNQLDCWKLPIHLAAANGRLAVFQELLQRFPDQLTRRDGCHHSYADLAKNSERPDEAMELVKWLHHYLEHDAL